MTLIKFLPFPIKSSEMRVTSTCNRVVVGSNPTSSFESCSSVVQSTKFLSSIFSLHMFLGSEIRDTSYNDERMLMLCQHSHAGSNTSKRGLLSSFLKKIYKPLSIYSHFLSFMSETLTVMESLFNGT